MIPSPTTVGLISTVLAFVSAVLYLVAYWGAFSLNVFEFVSMESLVRAAIYPLFVIAATVVVHLLFYGPLVFRSDVIEPPRLVVRDAITTDATEPGGMTPAVRLRIWLIVVLVFVTWAAYVGIFGEWEQVPYVLAVLLAIALAKHLVSSLLLSAEVPHPVARLIVVSVLLSIPALSFAHGVVRANSLIFRRGDFVYVLRKSVREA